ncbi:MOSC and FAD-binding oxidoreductase domain-containing protein [Mycobacterium sp. CVI_P3]|uniref:MOSC and FAD-binding oxidoreductase domain-containing protein n=1 Tax=Mycobacterium pinniadriaticum TaxID=2994102 RepID=A0ABT3SIV6_9MYCO|nr:MOSC and FAD-binding oxidoreductase domain-containing protein [Mycobacterium pinniadriaticum]MCX2933047.1 MOSC and FAD-binding oxidoreductase domain-containing protein [Mycobacterium pinniadriaticum]MCX2939469.1 MOSC and FAD-binding oxidoreductase domain-containing protein [Mycobacterium pinniadriaticum]
MAELVSVNVGLPTDVQWNGHTVRTGAWKAPVSGPRMVRRLNIDGDGQGDLAGHGGENRAVLVYQIASYEHWAAVLGRDDLTPGAFGENLTVDGLPDDEVCIGDQYRIGDVVLEVTQPRVTCYRVGMRLGEPRMAALLVAHHRPGFYCRVLTEGTVTAGQPVVKIADGPQRVSVAEIDALLYLPGHQRAALQRAVDIPALSPGWKTSLQSLIDQDSATTGQSGNSGLTGVAAPVPAWPGFRTLEVTAVRDESRHVRSMVLADPSTTPLPKWRAGQSIVVRVRTDPGEAAVVRNYSLSNGPGSARYRIGVKREPFGAVSAYLHDHVSVGDMIEVAAPRGSFFLDDSPHPVVLISAGVGITPMLSMLHALADSESTRPVWWLHSARNGAEHAFAGETRELLKRLPHSRSHVFYSRPDPADRAPGDCGRRGRLSALALRELGLPVDAQVFVCGPEPFMEIVRDGLTACGISADNIHAERFGARSAITPGIATAPLRPPHLPEGPRGTGPNVQFARSGLSAPWRPVDRSLLDFAEACDVPTRWSCRTGVCHTCETGLLSGRVHYDPEPLWPAAEGNVLVCVATPAEDIVIDL